MLTIAKHVRTGQRSRSMVVIALALLAADSRAFAGDDDLDGSASLELREIIVTAQKRPEPLSSIPLSVSALSSEDLVRQGVRDMTDLARVVPGLYYQAVGTYGMPQISIRSILSDVGAATTGVYVDDVPILKRNDCICQNVFPRIFDLERVEVLRGPQGTLYGAGSEGGTVRFVTKAPDLNSRSGYGRAATMFTESGGIGYELGAAVGGPIINDNLGFRASAWRRTDSGYIDRVSSDGRVLDPDSNRRQADAARLALTWAPAPRFTVTPAFYYQRTLEEDTALHWEEAGFNRQKGALRQPIEDRLAIASSFERFDFNRISLEFITSHVGLKEKTTSDSTYFDVAVFSTFDPNDALPTGAIVLPSLPDFTAPLINDRAQNVWTQEIRFTSKTTADTRLSWVAGAFWQQDKTTSKYREIEDLDLFFGTLWGATTEDVFGVPNVGPYSFLWDLHTTEKQLAGFGDVSYKVTHRLKLTAGLRIARSGFSFSSDRAGPWNGGEFSRSGSQSETPVIPKLNAAYALDRGIIYATAADGYRIGGANESFATVAACAPDFAALGRTDVPATYNSDKIRSYELGAKSRIFHDHLEFATSAYWINWDEIQGSVFLPTCALAYTTNLGSAVSRGMDLAATAHVSGNLTLGVTAGYGDGHYTETTRVLGSILAKDGDSLRTPAFTGALFAQYQRSSRSGYQSYTRIDYTYSSAYARTPSAGVVGADSTVKDASAIALVSLRTGLRNEQWDFTVFADNLLDKRTVLFRSHVTADSASYLSQAVRPRMIGVMLSRQM